MRMPPVPRPTMPRILTLILLIARIATAAEDSSNANTKNGDMRHSPAQPVNSLIIPEFRGEYGQLRLRLVVPGKDADSKRFLDFVRGNATYASLRPEERVNAEGIGDENPLDPQDFPQLMFVDVWGNIVAKQKPENFKTGKDYDSTKLDAWLTEWTEKEGSPDIAVNAAVAFAREYGRQVFVMLNLGNGIVERVLRSPKCARVLCKDYVVVVLHHDFSRLVLYGADLKPVSGKLSAYDLMMRFAGDAGKGLPLFAVLDAQGKVVHTSVQPGYLNSPPGTGADVLRFMKLIEDTSVHMTKDDKKRIVDAFFDP